MNVIKEILPYVEAHNEQRKFLALLIRQYVFNTISYRYCTYRNQFHGRIVT